MNPRVVGFLFIGAALLLVVFFVADLFLASGNRSDASWSVFSSDPANPDAAYEPSVVLPEGRDRYKNEILEDIEAREFLEPDEFRAAVHGKDYTYTVKTGDVIDDLAKRFLGRPDLKQRVFEANPELVPGRVLSPGAKIIIPFRYRDF